MLFGNIIALALDVFRFLVMYRFEVDKRMQKLKSSMGDMSDDLQDDDDDDEDGKTMSEDRLLHNHEGGDGVGGRLPRSTSYYNESGDDEAVTNDDDEDDDYGGSSKSMRGNMRRRRRAEKKAAYKRSARDMAEALDSRGHDVRKLVKTKSHATRKPDDDDDGVALRLGLDELSIIPFETAQHVIVWLIFVYECVFFVFLLAGAAALAAVVTSDPLWLVGIPCKNVSMCASLRAGTFFIFLVVGCSLLLAVLAIARWDEWCHRVYGRYKLRPRRAYDKEIDGLRERIAILEEGAHGTEDFEEHDEE